MRKIKLKKKYKISNMISLIVISLIIITIIILNYIGRYVTPVIVNYAIKEAKKISLEVITSSVNIDTKDMELFIEDENGINYNTYEINKILESTSKKLRKNLKKLEDGKITNLKNIVIDKKKLKKGIIYEVPISVIFNNGLLSNIGFKVPVKLNLIGDIETNITTDIKEYGINNAIVKLSLEIKVTEQVILPFSEKEIKIKTSIPLVIKLVKGEVPSYYNPYTLSSK